MGSPGRAAAGGLARRVLLLDDSEQDCRPTLAWLRESGSEVVIAPDGAAALACLEQEAFDLILVDMPGADMSGYRAIRMIRAREAEVSGPRLPVLALTADALREDGPGWLEAGCDALLAKPVDERALLEAMRGCDEDLLIETDPDIADLLSDYLAHRRADIATLWKALPGGSWTLVCRLGHDMKGSGRMYGLPRVSELGARLESAGMASDGREAALAVSSLESFVARVARRTPHPVAPR